MPDSYEVAIKRVVTLTFVPGAEEQVRQRYTRKEILANTVTWTEGEAMADARGWRPRKDGSVSRSPSDGHVYLDDNPMLAWLLRSALEDERW